MLLVGAMSCAWVANWDDRSQFRAWFRTREIERDRGERKRQAHPMGLAAKYLCAVCHWGGEGFRSRVHRGWYLLRCELAWYACDVGESEVEEERERASVREGEEVGVRIRERP